MKEREDELFHDFLNTALIFYPAVGGRKREKRKRGKKGRQSHLGVFMLVILAARRLCSHREGCSH